MITTFVTKDQYSFIVERLNQIGKELYEAGDAKSSLDATIVFTAANAITELTEHKMVNRHEYLATVASRTPSVKTLTELKAVAAERNYDRAMKVVQ
jgi:hypothetical protein